MDADTLKWAFGGAVAVLGAITGFFGKAVIAKLSAILEELKNLNVSSARHDERINFHGEKLKEHEERIKDLEGK